MNTSAPLESVGYRGWQGVIRSPWRTSLTFVRVGWRLLYRSWLYWGLMALGLLNFLFNFAFIYLKATLVIRSADIAPILDAYRVTGTGDAYAQFMHAQAAITILLLAFAGSSLVGSDYRQGGMVFYLSRSIGKRHYIAGKLLMIASVVLAITTLPALVLYFQYGILSSSLQYFRDEWRIGVGIVGYGMVLAVVQSMLLFAVSAWIPRTVPLVMTWLGLYTLPTTLGHVLSQIRGENRWQLLGIWDNMLVLGQYFFNDRKVGQLPTVGEASAVLLGLCGVCLVLIIRRVRVVEVVR